jgi:very-short-patch-repair endonuclease
MPKSSVVNGDIRGKPRTISGAAEIRALAGRQHGVFSRAQVVGLGLSVGQLDHWLRTARIESVHRGVYAWSRQLLSFEGRCMAAVLAVGGDAVVSHRSAAALWRIRSERGGPVHVTTSRKIQSREGITVHTLPLEQDERMVIHGVPLTSPARTLFDMAAILKPQALTRAIREADFLRLSGGPPLAALSDRYPGRTGAPAVRVAFDRGPGPPTRSELEELFVTLVESERLPRPEVNAVFHLGDRQIEPDCLWRAERLIAELDSHQAHGTRHSFEDDRERDRLLQTAGWRVVRITWRQLRDEPAAIAADLRRLLAAGPPGPTPPLRFAA